MNAVAAAGFVAGARVSGPIDAEPVTDPSTGAALCDAMSATGEQAEEAVDAAVASPWGTFTPGQRAKALLDLADAIERHGEELSALECRNVGKPAAQMAEELEFVVDNLRFFAGAARTSSGPVAREYAPGVTSMVRRDPLGIVAAILPWNYPLMTAVWKAGAALAAGNTAILKPAELTPLTALAFAELAAEQLPPGTLQVLCGGGEAGQRLAAHPRIAMVCCTGSPETGRAVAATAAATLKRVHLELGGNCAALVLDDADLDAAVTGIAAAAFVNAGQDCVAAARVVCTPAVYDDVVAGLAEAADAAAGKVGPVISARHRERVDGLVRAALGDGGKAVTGGGPGGGPGFFYEPTVLAGVDQRSRAVQEEIFGPAVTVQRAEDEEQALTFVSGVRQGLAASVWTRDVGRALALVPRIATGAVWVNSHLSLVSEAPHGGVKESGYGSDMAVFSVDDLTVARHVSISHARVPDVVQ